MLANLHTFPSDLCIALMGLGAHVVVGRSSGEQNLNLTDFVTFNMTGYVLKSIVVPLGLPLQTYKTFKVAIRNVNAHAIVNAAFNAIVTKGVITNPPIIAYGNIQAKQVRMTKTEAALVNQPLNAATLQKVLTVLAVELNPDPSIPRTSYRTGVALGMFYKYFLSLVPANSIPPNIASGMTKLIRGVSSGQQTFQTDPIEYPLSEPIHKLGGLLQTSGEALYTNDIPSPQGTLYGAFVLSTVASGTIQSIDTSKALAMEGVVAWIDASDVPGTNITDAQVPIFAKSEILYNGQAIGLIVATSQGIAIAAAKLVLATYTNVSPTPILTIAEAIAANSIYPINYPVTQEGDVEKGLQ